MCVGILILLDATPGHVIFNITELFRVLFRLYFREKLQTEEVEQSSVFLYRLLKLGLKIPPLRIFFTNKYKRIPI